MPNKKSSGGEKAKDTENKIDDGKGVLGGSPPPVNPAPKPATPKAGAKKGGDKK